MLQKIGSNDFVQNRCIVGPWRVLKIPKKLKDLYDLILVSQRKKFNLTLALFKKLSILTLFSNHFAQLFARNNDVYINCWNGNGSQKMGQIFRYFGRSPHAQSRKVVIGDEMDGQDNDSDRWKIVIRS